MTWVYRGEIKAEIKIDVGSVPNEAETHLFFFNFYYYFFLSILSWSSVGTV